MLKFDFSGPYALLPNEMGLPYVLANAAAWGPGLYLWTFLYNKAHRVNFIGVATQNVAQRQNEHLADFLAGRRTVYRVDDLAAEGPSPAYRPEDGRERFISEIPAMMRHLASLQLFFAPFSGPHAQLERVGAALVAHFQRLGGIAVNWLDNEPVEYDPHAYGEALGVRFGRPAFIASMPDEIHI